MIDIRMAETNKSIGMTNLRREAQELGTLLDLDDDTAFIVVGVIPRQTIFVEKCGPILSQLVLDIITGIPPWDKDTMPNNGNQKVAGKAFLTTCKDCGEKVYGTHKIYYSECPKCGSGNIEVKRSDIDVLEMIWEE